MFRLEPWIVLMLICSKKSRNWTTRLPLSTTSEKSSGLVLSYPPASVWPLPLRYVCRSLFYHIIILKLVHVVIEEIMHRYACLFRKEYRSYTERHSWNWTERNLFQRMTLQCQAQADISKWHLFFYMCLSDAALQFRFIDLLNFVLYNFPTVH